MGWITYVAGRLIVKRRGVPPPVMSVLGIAVGVLALTVIISVMNGFQLGFMESILEISSYYVRLEFPHSGEAANGANNPLVFGDSPESSALIAQIKTLPNVTAAVPFREVQALIRGDFGQQAALIRGLYPEAFREDRGMAERLVFEEGAFDLKSGDSILLGAELAERLRVELGDEVRLVSVSGSGSFASADEEASESFFIVKGIFRSGFYEYDLGLGFINFDRAGELEDGSYTLGIKLDDRFKDKKTAAAIMELAPSGQSGAAIPLKVKTWRDYNRAFFGALRTEKLFMFVLVGLIFIVVALNIYQAQRRIVLERQEEIGLLRAVGAGTRAVRLVFVWDGLVIGLIGAGSGTALGLLVSFNIASVFSLLEKIVNGILYLLQRGGGFAVFSPAVFYIKELKARVIPHEALLIFLFGLFSALAAAWFASLKVSRIKPAEVLRYE